MSICDAGAELRSGPAMFPQGLLCAQSAIHQHPSLRSGQAEAPASLPFTAKTFAPTPEVSRRLASANSMVALRRSPASA